MNNFKRFIALFLVLSLMIFTVACGKEGEIDNSSNVNNSNQDEESSNVNESQEDVVLLVYSGAGLKKPMTEIAEVFEEENGIKIEYIFAGSTQLLSQIELSGKGDVFIVGSKQAYETSVEKELTYPSKDVAYHNPIIGVPKGNPANINSLEDMANPGVKVILGDEKANAIGQTSQKLIEKTGLTGINDNVVAKTATVNEILVHLESKNADAAIVTEDSAFGNENIETIAIPEDINIQQIIPIGALKASKNLDKANIFVDFVSSDRGKEIFEKYGFPSVK
ncbi:molybdate ABC transporter substrate-binding protein [Tissierella sp. P1]|uniref:molybdate ABC transporter substrate-binding protein n=1 Tax=unclassified Tissierella TaxID=2638726 RepID=UPI000BA02F4A|nr:molybdate ABC transporter substrate-binding protein [Tissierella sp. P1]OZV14090.1 molybdate ABC transporter substrate-binding protein [Tissierella sp. P1]